MLPSPKTRDFTLKSYVDIVWKRKRIVIAVTLVVSLFSVVAGLLFPREYQAEASIMMTDPDASSHLIRSGILAQRVSERTKPPVSAKEILSSVRIRREGGGNLVRVFVTGPDRAKAVSIADAWVSEFSRISPEPVHIIEEARPKPLPRGGSAAYFLGAGFLLSIIGCFILEAGNRTITRPGEVEYYAQMPLLGDIRVDSKDLAPQGELDMVSYLNPGSLLAESLRNIRVSLILGATDEDTLEAVMITSSVAGEGKTFIAVNLAIDLAHATGSTLYIDADLRKEGHGERFSRDKQDAAVPKGFVDVMLGKCSVEEAVTSTEVPGLSVMGPGTHVPHPGALLQSMNFDDLMNDAKFHFKHVIVDAPPVSISEEATTWATECDGLIFVVGAGSTALKDITESRQKIEGKTAILGAVLNRIS